MSEQLLQLGQVHGVSKEILGSPARVYCSLQCTDHTGAALVIRLHQSEARETLMRGVYTGMVGNSPSASAVLREKFRALRQEHSKIALKNTRPLRSQLIPYRLIPDTSLRKLQDYRTPHQHVVRIRLAVPLD
jgi:hypothetical protein